MPVGFDLRGEAASLSGIGEGGVAAASGSIRVSEIDQQTGAGADEVHRESGQGVGELTDRVGCAEAGEGVAAPAVEVGAAEEQERQCGVDGVGREQLGRGVEGSARVVGVAGGGEGFAVRGGQPSVQ
jgi:hypothetical protein